MDKPVVDPLKELLEAILAQLQAVSFGLKALESAATSPKYGGRQLTQKQLTTLQSEAAAKEADIYATLRAKVSALPPTRSE